MFVSEIQYCSVELMMLLYCSQIFGHSVLCSSDKELNRWLGLLFIAQVFT